MTIAAAIYKDEENIRNAFVTGNGLGWHEHSHDLFHGTERLFKPGYLGNLVSAWIPALDGVEAKLQAGGDGRRHRVRPRRRRRSSSRRQYPNVEIVGFDYHEGSIDTARKRAAEAGVADRVRFEVASAQDFPGDGYDLVCIFDALHDMGDPVGGARHIRESWPTTARGCSSSRWRSIGLEDNVNPVSRIFYAGAVGHLHARRRGAARRLRAREPGERRTVAASCSARRATRPVPPGHRDAVQPGVRGAQVATTGTCGRVPPEDAPATVIAVWASWTRTSSVSAMP